MTNTFENAIANLVTKTTQLTDEVIDKMADIDQRVTDAKTELDGHWLDKATEINGEWVSKKAEIDAKLNTFDNRIIYVAPTAQNAGTGVDSDNATTLADALSNHLIPSVANTIKLAQGVHVLPAQELKDIFLVNFEPDGVYDANNPAVICTPNTIDSMISTNVSGITSESQTCDAHGHDESTFHFINSTVQFNNVRLRGTRHCLKLEQSTVFTSGDMDLDLWVYSASCTSHSGTAIHAIDSQIYSASELDINLWHPDYTGCSDVLVEHVAPIYLDNSKHIVKGLLAWSSNLLNIADYPTQETMGWYAPFEVSHATAFNIINGSHLHIDRLYINNVKQLFWADNGSLQISFMEMGEHSAPLQFLGQARGHDARIAITDRDIAWHDDTDPHIVRIENVGNVPEQASLIAYDGAQVYLDGVKLTTTATASSTFMAIDTADVLLQNSIIYAPDRDNNQGFMQITHNTNGKVTCKNSQLATRLGDNDTGFVALRGGFTQERNNQLNFSQDYQVDTYGQYQDSEGSIFGVATSNEVVATHPSIESIILEDKTFKVPEDYSSLETAVEAAGKLLISPESTITIELAAGEHTIDQSLIIRNLENVIIKGAQPLQKSLVSFVSVTGSARNWSVTLQLSDVTNVNVGDSLQITNITGTGTPQVHLGIWQIIAKSGNNVTVKNLCPNSSFPSNTVTGGTGLVQKTLISSSHQEGITLEHAKIQLQNIAFQNVITVISHSDVVFTNIGCLKNNSTFISGSDGTLQLNNVAICGCADRGISILKINTEIFGAVILSSNQNVGLFFHEARINQEPTGYRSLYCLYNTIGIFAIFGSTLRLHSGGNYFLHNSQLDFRVERGSYATLAYQGSPKLSPALNTVGNDWSCITK
ncbi:hypothetical protein [Candidatus Albibeggiatoa sp. nov. NOAA]|uniref:hypothetical protein n=1 Tax=Candidatus Albibeggiatoa sp. nov. NOAA TaxID=3162724 RepID=UPI0033009F9D|nr:hypothetical protein [Thiotrichaceae bacterium]